MANEDGTFGNRFDDSEAYFRVLYAASTALPILRANNQLPGTVPIAI
jgi:hypothetical protein